MQEKVARRSNQQRREQTIEALLSAARALFLAKGFAGTATPEIVSAAGVTRGALYHHFEDKQALFRAVIEAEMAAVARQIERATPPALPPFEALIAGGRAFFAAMAQPGRISLLLIEAPAVLGFEELAALDRRHGGRTLAEGLSAAIEAGVLRELPVQPLAMMLSALYDRGALALAAGKNIDEIQAVIEALLGGLKRDPAVHTQN
jgi:AcrR family transcriptional regulator